MFILLKCVGAFYGVNPSALERFLPVVGAWLYKRRLANSVEGFSWVGYDKGLQWIRKTDDDIHYGTIELSDSERCPLWYISAFHILPDTYRQSFCCDVLFPGKLTVSEYRPERRMKV